MKERKYQPIFSKETKIRIGNELVKGAGSTFKKLITNLLDTEKLYNNGAQKKFLDEYFGPNAVQEDPQGEENPVLKSLKNIAETD